MQTKIVNTKQTFRDKEPLRTNIIITSQIIEQVSHFFIEWIILVIFITGIDIKLDEFQIIYVTISRILETKYAVRQNLSSTKLCRCLYCPVGVIMDDT